MRPNKYLEAKQAANDSELQGVLRLTAEDAAARQQTKDFLLQACSGATAHGSVTVLVSDCHTHASRLYYLNTEAH